jgi:shikimate dehydrogenase
MSKSLAVLGSPISHSKSPQIQLAALQTLGIEATFDRIDVSDLAAFLKLHQSFDALSLTMPLKEQARSVADWEHPLVERTNSANYLLRKDESWQAFNTDVFGIQKAAEGLEAKTVGILGTGATARSALVAMSDKDTYIWGRKSPLAEELAKNYGARLSQLDEALSCDLVISTLPGDALSALASSGYPGVLLDVVYSRPSPAGFSGYRSGLSMLIWQAIGQLRLLVNGADHPLPNEEQLASVMLSAAELAE